MSGAENTKKRKQGQPTKYTDEIGAYICHVLSTDVRSLRQLCKDDPKFPPLQTIHTWRANNKSFSYQYEKARQLQVQLLAESIIETSKGRRHYYDSEGNERVDSGEVAARKLEIDTIKWYASKLAPKVYGDKQQLEVLTEDNEKLRKEAEALRAELAKKNEKEY